jgi:signal transduction histidine kinase
MTVLFAVAGWLLLRQASEALAAGVEEEVRGSLASVEALWRARGDAMRSSTALLSTMSDVRAAFGTRDPSTIEDTAAELWARSSASPRTQLLVAAPGDGAVLATIGADKSIRQLPPGWLAEAQASFPRQASGFAYWNSMLWQVVVTPVYVDTATAGSRALLNVLVAAEPVGEQTLEQLRKDTGGTGFLLVAGGRGVAQSADAVGAGLAVSRELELKGMDGKPVGTLTAIRPLQLVDNQIETLRKTIVAGWLAAMAGGLLLSFWLTRRITKPVGELERAAIEVSRENYSVRIPETSRDELGLLARTFNQMCESIESARTELIRREQIHAAGRLAASIAHDLRNPLSAVSGGAEMIAEMDLPPEQAKRAARNVHAAAMRMQQMLEELSQSVRKKSAVRTEEDLERLLASAVESQQSKLDERKVALSIRVSERMSAAIERSRVERVIINLISNAIEAMKDRSGDGQIRIEARRSGNKAEIDVRDNGPGIPDGIRASLFQPFVTQGKKNGLGLGLALSRQTLLDHGGDLEAIYVEGEPGAWFRLTLPLIEEQSAKATE